MTATLTWLAETTASLSPLIALLLFIRRPVARHLGAATAYRLWLLVPVHLGIPALFPDTFAGLRVDLAPITFYPGYGGRAGGLPVSSAWLLLAGAWAAGITASTARLGRAVRSAQCLVRHSLSLDPDHRPILVGAGLDPRRVRRSRHIDTPTVAGFFRPVLLLPHGFLESHGPSAARLVLAHEACHVRRRDNLATAAAWLCTACFWFNPLVYPAFRAFRADQELSCDGRALRHADNGERKEYGRALVKSAAANGPAAVTSNWQDLKYLKERTMMLKSHRHSPARSLAGLALVTGLSLAAAGLSVSAFALDEARPNSGALDQGPVLVEHAPPKYPAQAAEEKIEGRVVVTFTVDTDGRVRDASVVESKPGEVFNAAAIAALEQWRFEPARKGGKAVPVQAQQAIEFELD